MRFCDLLTNAHIVLRQASTDYPEIINNMEASIHFLSTCMTAISSPCYFRNSFALLIPSNIF